MQTDKKNAISYDHPEYLIRNKHILLQKDARQFFYSPQKHKFPITIKHPDKTIKVNDKFGVSKDTPFQHNYTIPHRLTPQIFDPQFNSPKIQKNQMRNAHLSLNQFIKNSHNDPSLLFNLLSKSLPSRKNQNNQKYFKRLLDSNIHSREGQLISSFKKDNLRMLVNTAGMEKDNQSTYKSQLNSFSKTFLTPLTNDQLQITELLPNDNSTKINLKKVEIYLSDTKIRNLSKKEKTLKKDIPANSYSDKEVIDFYYQSYKPTMPETPQSTISFNPYMTEQKSKITSYTQNQPILPKLTFRDSASRRSRAKRSKSTTRSKSIGINDSRHHSPEDMNTVLSRLLKNCSVKKLDYDINLNDNSKTRPLTVDENKSLFKRSRKTTSSILGSVNSNVLKTQLLEKSGISIISESRLTQRGKSRMASLQGLEDLPPVQKMTNEHFSKRKSSGPSLLKSQQYDLRGVKAL